MIDFSKAKPREVEAYLREQVRKIFGNEVEDRTTIMASHGFYHMVLRLSAATGRYVAFRGFRKTEVKMIVKSLKALK